jgi:hypothetical protein
MVKTLEADPVHTQACVAKVTELLLKGYSWREVRACMLLSQREFSDLLSLAVDKAHGEALVDQHVGQLGDVR